MLSPVKHPFMKPVWSYFIIASVILSTVSAVHLERICVTQPLSCFYRLNRCVGNMMDSDHNPSCQAVCPVFYCHSNSFPSVSHSKDGWPTTWNDPHLYFNSTDHQLLANADNRRERGDRETRGERDTQQTATETLETEMVRGAEMREQKRGKNSVIELNCVPGSFSLRGGKASDVWPSQKASDTSYNNRKWHPILQTDSIPSDIVFSTKVIILPGNIGPFFLSFSSLHLVFNLLFCFKDKMDMAKYHPA